MAGRGRAGIVRAGPGQHPAHPPEVVRQHAGARRLDPPPAGLPGVDPGGAHRGPGRRRGGAGTDPGRPPARVDAAKLRTVSSYVATASVPLSPHNNLKGHASVKNKCPTPETFLNPARSRELRGPRPFH